MWFFDFVNNLHFWFDFGFKIIGPSTLGFGKKIQNFNNFHEKIGIKNQWF
jgi:hypothetical protein